VASSSSEPLSTAQAKARLRSAVEGLSPEPWVRDRPWEAMLIAAVSGFLLGVLPPRRRGPVARELLGIFVGPGKRRGHGKDCRRPSGRGPR
jgi:hypothetical protein